MTDTQVFLVAIEEESYLIPFRTQKSSPPSPMVLRTRAWESRSPPGFFIFEFQNRALVLDFFLPLELRFDPEPYFKIRLLA
jgi:hypothetical protein